MARAFLSFVVQVQSPGISWRLGMQNLAHFAICSRGQVPPPLSRSNNAKADHGGSNHLTNALL
jgi:hypothetical protein